MLSLHYLHLFIPALIHSDGRVLSTSIYLIHLNGDGLKDYFTAGKMNVYEKLNIYIVEMSN